MPGITPAGGGYPYPSLAIGRPMLVAIEQHLHDQGCAYGLGAKAPSLGCETTAIRSIDCSGFVRYALYRASGVVIPDGSVDQHDWVDAQGFKRSTVADGHNQDNAVRIAFLSPDDGGGIGHVMLLLNGQTLESHGHCGPDRRVWGSMGFMAKCAVYVLAPPV